MVSLVFNSSSPSRSRFVAESSPSLAQRVRSALDAVKAEWRIRRAVRSVEALDARQLVDIGVQPGGIEDAVRHGR